MSPYYLLSYWMYSSGSFINNKLVCPYAVSVQVHRSRYRHWHRFKNILDVVNIFSHYLSSNIRLNKVPPLWHILFSILYWCSNFPCKKVPFCIKSTRFNKWCVQTSSTLTASTINMIKQQKALFEDSSGWLLSKYFGGGCAVTICQYLVYIKLKHQEDDFSYLALVCLGYHVT